MKDEFFSFIKELGTELIGEFISLGFLKKMLSGVVKGKIAGKEVEDEAKKEAEKIPEVKFSGIFNMSDEIAFMGTLALMESDPNLQSAAANVSAFVANLKRWQQRNFRVAVGSLAHIDYLKKVVDVPQEESVEKAKNGFDETKKSGGKKEEVKVNLGVEFLRSFARLDESQKKDVCKSTGILEPSLGQKIKQYAQDNEADILQKIKGFRASLPRRDRVYGGFWREFFWRR